MTLKKLFSIIQIPKFETFQNLSSQPDQQSIDFEEVLELKWQQKIFSKTEYNYYGQKENCNSDLEKKYHQLVKALPEGHECGLLFTYTNDDKYLPPDNFGVQDIKFTKLRKNVEDKSKGSENNYGLFVDPTQKYIATRYRNGNNFENFVIMADLEPATLLFTIKYRKSDNSFLIYPDFNEPSNAYYLEIDEDRKQIYSFYVENLSSKSNEATQKIKQKKQLDEIHDETKELLKKINFSARDQNFIFPKFSRTVLMLEIIRGKDFEYDNIHVQFNIRLPKFAKIIEGVQDASTHSVYRAEDYWNFGYCHAIIFDIDDEFFMSATKLDLIAIEFDVISIDPLWGRERNEGAACLKFPIEPAKSLQEFELKCFRDLQGGSWITDCLERFFLGGIRSSRFNKQNQNGVNNFYGNQTVSTGSLKVKVQQIRQIKMSQRQNMKMKTIEEIINCYHKAKAKLE